MNTASLATRLAAAIAAVSVTLMVFSAVASIAGPERNVLMAQIEHNAHVATAQANARAMAAAPGAQVVATTEGR